jgi:hypothetical protein
MAILPQKSREATQVLAPVKKDSALKTVVNFFRKAYFNVWSIPKLDQEMVLALTNWQKACLLTEAAIAPKNRASRELEKYRTWHAGLNPAYRARKYGPLQVRLRQLEIASYTASYNFRKLEAQELRWINRLIQLKALGHHL